MSTPHHPRDNPTVHRAHAQSIRDTCLAWGEEAAHPPGGPVGEQRMGLGLGHPGACSAPSGRCVHGGRSGDSASQRTQSLSLAASERLGLLPSLNPLVARLCQRGPWGVAVS